MLNKIVVKYLVKHDINYWCSAIFDNYNAEVSLFVNTLLFHRDDILEISINLGGVYGEK